MVKDNIARLLHTRNRLAARMPDPSTALAGSLMTRMIRCNKPGCRFCEKGKGKGHGPLWILSTRSANQEVRQIPVPAHLKPEVEEGIRRYTQIQNLLKQISQVNQDLLRERKKR